jgi:FtsH-binding integral membrane protein
MYYNSDYTRPYAEDELAEGRAQFFTKTYGIMAVGLLITFAVAMAVAQFLPQVAYNTGIVLAVCVAELATVWILSARLQRASYGEALGMFLFYSMLTGVTFSSIFLLFDIKSISVCFLASAGAFGAMAIVGHSTKRDLSPMRGILLGGLISILVLSVISLIFRLAALDILICCIGIAIFLGLTAYDTQKLGQMYEASAGTAMAEKLSVFGALQLYLDFVNLFQYILVLFGGRRRN